MSWLDTQTSLYKCNSDNIGQPVTFRDILLTRFAIGHNWYYKDEKAKWISGHSSDLETIIQLRALDRIGNSYKTKKEILKSKLQSFTPAALLETKKKGMVKEIARTGIMQLDFDYSGIKDFNIEELKQAVFSLPFIGFCGLSCSGDGFYALALIAEPERLSEYAEHVFIILEKYGIMADTSKGKKVENLRYLSYDSRMLMRENPAPLKVTRFKRKEAAQKQQIKTAATIVGNSNNLVNSQLKMLGAATVGNRWQSVQQVSYTLGGLNDDSLLDLVKQAILMNREFAGQEDKYLKCAEYCFMKGAEKPINVAALQNLPKNYALPLPSEPAKNRQKEEDSVEDGSNKGSSPTYS